MAVPNKAEHKGEIEMEYAIGVGLAILAGLFLSWAGLDKDRAAYPVILIVIAVLTVYWRESSK